MNNGANGIDRHIGSRMRLRRSSLGLSEIAVADAIGVTARQVRKYEAGENRMNADKLVQASQVLGVPISYFYSDAEPPAPAPPPALPKDADALVRMFCQHPPKVRSAILQLVKAVSPAAE